MSRFWGIKFDRYGKWRILATGEEKTGCSHDGGVCTIKKNRGSFKSDDVRKEIGREE